VVSGFGFNIDVNFNPGNAIQGLTQFNTLVDRTKASMVALSQGQVIGGGIDNFVSSAQRGLAPITGLLNTMPKITNEMAKISTGATQAGNALTQIGSKAQSASSSIQSIGTATSGAAVSVQKFSAANVNLGSSMSTLGARAGVTASELAAMNGPLQNIGLSINRFVQVLNSAGQSVANSARLMTPFNAALVQTGNVAQQTATKFSAGLAPAVAAVGGPLNNLNANLAGTSGGLTNLGSSATQSATGLGRLRELFSGNRGLVFGMSALFGTITGIVFEFQLMADASKQVAESQAVVNDLIAKGQQGTGKYQQAVQALGKDNRFLEFSTRNMALAFTNLIPDILLITNGIIQLTDKMRTVGTAGSAVTNTMSAVTSSMTTATTATTALGAAQATLGSGITTSANSFKAVVPILSQAGAGMIGMSAAGNAAVGGLTAVNTATTGLKTGLASVVTSAGTAITSMGNIGLIAKTSATPLGTLGVAGRTAATELELLATAGISTKAALFAAIAAPVALAAAFVGMGLILKDLIQIFIDVKNSQVPMIAIEEEAVVAAYKLGTAHETAAQQAETAISNLASKLTSDYESMISGAEQFATNIVTALTPGKPGALKQSDIKQPEIGATQGPGAGTSTATAPSTGGGGSTTGLQDYLNSFTLGKPNTVGTGPPAPAEKNRFIGPLLPGGLQTRTPVTAQTRPLTDLEKIEQDRLGTTKRASDLLTEASKPGNLFGNYPKDKQLDLPTYEKAIDIVTKLADKEHEVNAIDRSKYLRELQGVITGTVEESGAKSKATEAEKDFDKAASEAEKTFIAQNTTIGKMPAALQEVLGVHQQYTEQVMIAGKMVTLEDKALQEHVALIDQEAAGYTSSTAILGQSVRVKEQLVDIGNKVVGGVEEELNHVTALNLFWGQMNTTIADSILSNQQLTISSIDVTAALTNQTQNQFLTNEGMIAGKEAAQSFAEELVVGVAQTKAYDAGIKQIADTIGVQLPSGLRATTDELKAASLEMLQFGSNATTSAQMLNDRFGSAFKMVGDLVGKAIEGGKAFSKAWKDMDLSALPKGQSGFFKDMIKDMGDAQEKAQALTTGVNLVITAIAQGSLTGKQAGADIKSFGDELTKIADLDPRLTPITTTLKSFLDNIPAGQKLQGLRTFSDIWINDILPAFEDGVVTGQEINSIMEKLNNNIDIQASSLEMTAKQWKKFSKELDQAQKDANKAADALNKVFPTLGLQDFTFGEDINKKNQDKKEFKKDTTPTTPTGIPGVVGRAPTEQEVRDFINKQNKPPTPKTPPGGTGIGTNNLAAFWESVGGGGGGGKGTTTPVPDAKAVQTATAAINAALASSQTAFANLSNQGTNSMALLVGRIKAHITTIGTYFAKTIPTDLALSQTAFANFSIQGSNSMALLIGRMKAHITTITTYFAKTIPTDLALSQTAFANFAIQGSNSMALLITRLKAHVTTITTYFAKTIPADLLASQTAFATFSVDASNSMSKLIGSLKAHVTTITTYFTKTIPDNLQTAADAFNQFMVDSSNAMATLISNIKPHITTLITYFTKTIPDIMATASDAVGQFGSDFTSVMSDVQSAAAKAMSAVNALGSAVDSLDGKTAKVTITTEFKTSGSPPSGGSKAGDKAANMLGAVIAASSPRSFQFGGSIETSHGPQMAIFGDNPGGAETVAFIPHDNPFPTLRKLEKLFKGRSNSEIVSRALDKAEEMWIDLHLQIDNIMDGEKVSRQILRKTFKRMRTRP
jgi:hypothetical protein